MPSSSVLVSLSAEQSGLQAARRRGGAVSGGAMAGPAMWAAWSADASVAFLQDVGSRTIGKWRNVVVGRLYPAAEHASFRREGFQRRREKDVGESFGCAIHSDRIVSLRIFCKSKLGKIVDKMFVIALRQFIYSNLRRRS